MLTTVPSMKAMLEARIVATRTQVLACARQGTAALVDLITAPSPGALMMAMDAIRGAFGSEDRRQWHSLRIDKSLTLKALAEKGQLYLCSATLTDSRSISDDRRKANDFSGGTTSAAYSCRHRR